MTLFIIIYAVSAIIGLLLFFIIVKNITKSGLIERESLKSENKNLAEQIKKLEAELHQQLINLERIQTQFQEVSKQLEFSSQSNKDLTLRMEDYREKLSEADQQRSALISTVNEQKKQYLDKNQQLEDTSKIVLELRAKLEQQEKESKLITSRESEIKANLENAQQNLKDKITEAQKLETEKIELQQRIETLMKKDSESHAKISELNMALEKENKQYEEKIQVVHQAEQKLKETFENLAAKVLEAKSAAFSAKSKEQMDQVLTPLKEQLEIFRTRVEAVHTENKTGQELLKQTIDDLKKINTQISDDAQKLTNALKHDSKAQGTWGEMLLESILENSGLREGDEYVTQAHFKDDEGKSVRPDVIVKLPNNKQVVIDSKVSLTAYEKFVNEPDEVEKLKYLNEHTSSVRKHVTELSAKHYEKLGKLNSLDFVLLFIPIESAFLTAIEKDRALFKDAYDRFIVIVCPSTLMITLRTIHSLWNHEYRNKNVLTIAEEAGKMYDKFAGFVKDFEKIGSNMQTLKNSYDDAFNKLSKGSGNLVSKAEKLRILGVKTKSKLDQTLVEMATVEEAEEFIELEAQIIKEEDND